MTLCENVDVVVNMRKNVTVKRTMILSAINRTGRFMVDSKERKKYVNEI